MQELTPILAAGPAETYQLKVSDRLLVGVRGVAELLSISERHVRQLDSSGRLPMPTKLGGSKRFSVPELRGWVLAGCPARERWQIVRDKFLDLPDCKAP